MKTVSCGFSLFHLFFYFHYEKKKQNQCENENQHTKTHPNTDFERNNFFFRFVFNIPQPQMNVLFSLLTCLSFFFFFCCWMPFVFGCVSTVEWSWNKKKNMFFFFISLCSLCSPISDECAWCIAIIIIFFRNSCLLVLRITYLYLK